MKIALSFLLLTLMNFFAHAQSSPNVSLIANLDDYSQNGYTDCWGYTAPDGREYALLCVNHGTSIVDITENNNVREVAFIPSSGTKDIKTLGHYAYGVNENIEDYGMVIIDLSDLPNSATLVSQFTGFRSSHNIFIDENNAVLYAQNRNNTTRGDAVRVLDLSDPLHPAKITTFGIGCHDIFARGNIAYISESGNSSIGIYDLTIPATPIFIQRIPFPGNGFSHNSWLSADGSFLMTTEETTGNSIKLWDIRDSQNPEITDDYLADDGLAHNAFIKGRFAYVAHYTDGLRILDISDPFNIEEVGFYDTFPGSPTGFFSGAWGAYPFFTSGKVLISDISTGLYVVFFEGASDANTLDPKGVTDATAYSDFRSPNSIEIKWRDPEFYVSGAPLENFTIEIYRDQSHITSVADGIEQFIDTGLTDGQKYFYSLFAKDTNDSLSIANNVAAFAGGAPTPSPPTDLFFSASGADSLILHWQNPSENIDGTPMDDFAGLNLYLDEDLFATVTRTVSDTSKHDSVIIARPGQSYSVELSAIDNETPQNESALSATIHSPFILPFFDTFENQSPNNPTYWRTFDAEVNEFSFNPPSPPMAIHLDAYDNGGDIIESIPFDLSSVRRRAAIVSFWFQTVGQRAIGNTMITDSLFVEFQNSQGEWKTVRSYSGGENIRFFSKKTVYVGEEDAGLDATFFYLNFRMRFRAKSPYVATGGDFFVDDVSVGVDSSLVSVDELPSTIPHKAALFQNYPNPFNPETTIEFQLPSAQHVTFTIYNILGKRVKTLLEEKKEAGRHRVLWDGTDANGSRVSSGIYIYRMTAGTFKAANKLLLIQ